ncbi:longevity-assurance protein [Hypoxylon rubiginosum]|uniref:Longevity-assurance protein n=1 Tax=Hypoxylon rubiginosum TaxID=110542 RepID=A0ACC0DM37_9PEZI|nr:longevity-assurance protein [Hypoxylon rubiginosum]
MADTVASQSPGLRRPHLSCAVIVGLLLAHTCVPKVRPFPSRFLTLKGYNEQTGRYASGHDDLRFVAFCVVLFSGIRAGSMKFALAPLATHCGATPKNVYIYFTLPYFLNTRELWTNRPEKDLDVRHLITISPIAPTYVYFQNQVANLILVSMDVIELIFPRLKRLRFTAICDILFVLFVITWLVTRHVFYLMICWSAYFESPGPMPTAFAVRVLRGDSAEDVRSDDEYEETATDGERHEKELLAVNGSPERHSLGIVETVGVDGIDLAAWQQRERASKEISHLSGI